MLEDQILKLFRSKGASKDQEQRFLPVFIEELENCKTEIIIDALAFMIKNWDDPYNKIPSVTDILKQYKSMKYRDAQKREREQNRRLAISAPKDTRFDDIMAQSKKEGLSFNEMMQRLKDTYEVE